jgi:hypothetical protein
MTQEEAAERARTEIPHGFAIVPHLTRRVRGGWYFMATTSLP